MITGSDRHGAPRRDAASPGVVVRATLVTMVLALVGAGCGTNAATSDDGILDGVGRLPGYDFWAPVTLPDGVEVSFPLLEGGPIGPIAGGNRVLLIGDSILASTSRRYANEMCATLVPLGWQVSVEAEAGRFSEFGVRVVQSRLAAGWDAAVVYLGTNYEGNPDSYARNMRRIFDRLDPLPTVVLTTGEFRRAQREVNDVIRSVAGEFDHVRVLDWASVAGLRGVTGGDRIHLSETGRSVLAATVARALDAAPAGAGRCLESRFTDDSAIRRDVLPPAATNAPASPTTTRDVTTDSGSGVDSDNGGVDTSD
ncbi:MAG: SGNH/GDSL hydrolase family protein [Ilumatobacteraceae bacterium]